MMQKLERPSKEDFGQWRHSPAGEWYFAWLQMYFQHVVEGAVRGGTIATDSVDSTALSTVRTMTKANTLYEIGTEADYDSICGMMYGEEKNDNDEAE